MPNPISSSVVAPPVQQNPVQDPSGPARQEQIRFPQSLLEASIHQRVEEGRRAVGQQPLVSLGPHISASATALEQAVAQLAGTLPEDRKALPPTFGATIPPHGRSIQIDEKMVRKMMRHEVAGLSGENRLQTLQGMQRTLQKRIRHGYEIWRNVTNDAPHKPADMADVRDLTIFLMAKAAEKGEAFSDGAFNIEDPDHRLRNYLDSCSKMYQRASSHIDGFQRSAGGGHRSIDIPDLPHGMGTVLYGAMNADVQGMTGDRLFLKLEEHGCRLTSGLAPHRDPNVHEDRPLRFFRDVRQTLGHAVGFFRTFLRNISGGRLFPNSPDSRKERIPSDVVRDYKNLIKDFENRGPAELVAILRHNNPTSTAGGIRVMVKNLDQALGHLDSLDVLTDEQLSEIGSSGGRLTHRQLMKFAEKNGGETLMLLAQKNVRLTDKQVHRLATKGIHLTDNQIRQLAMMENVRLADRHLIRLATMEDVGLTDEHLKRLAGLNVSLTDEQVLRLATMEDVGLNPNRLGQLARMDEAVLEAHGIVRDEVLQLAGREDDEISLPHEMESADPGEAAEIERQDAEIMQLKDLRHKLQERLSQLSARFDGLDVRIGNEVVLNAGELSGEDPQQAVNSQARAMTASLLDVPADGFTPDRVQQFVRQLAQIGLHLDFAADADPDRMMSNALNPALISLSSEEMSRISNLLNSSLCRETMGATLDVMSVGAENLGPMDRSAQASAARIARKVYYMYSVMRQAVGLPDDDLPSTDDGLNTIRPLLVGAGTDAFLSRANLAVMTNEAGLLEHRTLQAGAMPLDDVRRLIGREETALGDYMRSVDRGAVDREQIGRTLVDVLMEDVRRTNRDNGLRDLNVRFVDDLLRDGVIVNGLRYGGQGEGIPDTGVREDQLAALDAFIEAVGGNAQARQIARIADQEDLQNLMTRAADADPGLGPLRRTYGEYASLAGRVLMPRPTVSITLRGEETGIHFEHSAQRVGGQRDGIDMEVGQNLSLDITLQGLGTADPAVRLDNWDMLYSSCPQQRITDMDQNLLRNALGENEFCLDVYLGIHKQAGEPNREAVTDSLRTALQEELQRLPNPAETRRGYRTLPEEFILDILRKPITVNDIPCGDVPLSQADGELDRFIEALDLDRFIDAGLDPEKRAAAKNTWAAQIAMLAYQNIPGAFDEVIRETPELGPVELAYAGHAAAPIESGRTRTDFTITTNDDGSVRLRLDYSQQKGAEEGENLEIGKTGYLDYTLTDLGTNSPQVRLDGWHMIYGSNRVPIP